MQRLMDALDRAMRFCVDGVNFDLGYRFFGFLWGICYQMTKDNETPRDWNDEPFTREELAHEASFDHTLLAEELADSPLDDGPDGNPW